MSSQPLCRLTNAYLNKFFTNKKLPYEEWLIIVDGISHVVDNHHVINSILNAKPEEKKIIADTLCELESTKHDINVFLKHLAFESNCLGQLIKS